MFTIVILTIGNRQTPADCTHLNNTDDPYDVLRMEQSENEHRLDFTPSEKMEIARRIEESLAGRWGGDRGNQHTGGKTANLPSCYGEKVESIAVIKM